MKKRADKKSTHLVIGRGEIGTALFNILKKKFDVSIRDKNDKVIGKFDVLHIAYPPIKNFVGITKKYIKEYKPSLVIIHSTVAVGTTKKIGTIAVHSPVRGIHPHLEKGMRTFTKYFGGPRAKIAERYFKEVGIPTESFPNPETTELLKILDTTYYGWNIVYAKETKRICDKYKVSFDSVYTEANKEYNRGYKKLGMPNVMRPVLKFMPGKIGGHCIVPNTKLLNDWLTNTLKKRNSTY